MAPVEPFAIEQWMNRYETTPGVLNIAETCAASISIEELVALNSDKDAAAPLSTSTKLTYGAVRGSAGLRGRVAAALFARGAPTPLPADNVIITQGAIVANFVLFYALVGAGDHVVCVYPTFQQLYSVPKSLGAEVSLWTLKKENGYVPDVRELETLVKSNTKMIVINQPNNPYGMTIPRAELVRIVEFAKARGIIVLSDEVYSPLYHSLDSGEETPPSILSLGYDKTVATGSMSKAFSLAGIRLGWIASRDEGILKAVAGARDYTTISVSQLDDQVASYALSDTVLPALLARNLALARTNLALLAAFVHKYSSVCSWTRPNAGTTAFLHFSKGKGGEPVDDPQFCLDVLEKTKAFVVPASVCFGGGKDFKGAVRVGYVCHTEVLKEALEKLGEYVEQNLLK